MPSKLQGSEQNGKVTDIVYRSVFAACPPAEREV